jgi:type IX secretion system PorP/SprF family membrane protein
MKKILFLVFCLTAIFARGQQIPQSSLYFINDFALNPAIAGSKSYMPILLSHRTQWANFKNAPSTQTFSVHGNLNQQGAGIHVVNTLTGPTGILSAQVAYSYQIKLNESNKLSFGIAPQFIQYSLAKEKLKLDESNDLTFNRSNARTNIFDASSGLYLQGKKYSLGLSAAQLLGSRFRKGDDLIKERLRRHFVLTANYDFTITDKICLSPIVMAKALESGAPYQLDANLKISFSDVFWTGLGYRASISEFPGDAAIIFMGIQKSSFVFAYGFDYSFSSMMPFTFGSHEVLLSYRFNKKKKSEGTSYR